MIAATDYSVYKSADYGNSWTTIWSNSKKVTSIAFNPKSPESIFVGTNEYIVSQNNRDYTEWMYTSKDGGSTWEKLLFKDGLNNVPFEEVIKIIVDPSDTTRIYVGIKSTSNSDGCLLVNHDDGVTRILLTASLLQKVWGYN